MKQIFYGEIDLDNLGAVTRQQNSLVKTYTDKNGVVHHTVKVAILQRDQPDKGGNTAAIKIYCKPDEQVEALKQKYWVGSLKESTPREPQQSVNQPAQQSGNDEPLLPY